MGIGTGTGRGGAREGAGRPTLDGSPRKKISATIPAYLAEIIKEEAKRQHVPASWIIAELIEKGIG